MRSCSTAWTYAAVSTIPPPRLPGDRQDRVPDQLAGAVIGDVAATVDGDNVGR